MWWAVGTAEPGCCENIADGGGPGAGRDASATRGATSGRKKAEMNKKEFTMEENSICQQKTKTQLLVHRNVFLRTIHQSLFYQQVLFSP